ncbi:MAG: DUF2277 domain-containing protein [Myxococcaceae bacterium]
MCRNIKTLSHFKPPATHAEIAASALQYVRKLSGMQQPSKENQKAFDRAVEKITQITRDLIHELDGHMHGEPRNRQAEQRKAKERGLRREEQLREKYGKVAKA